MDKRNSSYKQIVKSTSVFGGLQAVNVILGVVRSKLVALILGKAGVGVIGIYQNIIDLIRAVSSLGIETGGIRDIASNADNKEQQQYNISVFRWWVIFTSFLGLFLCALFSYPISVWMFGNGSYTLPIIFLSLAVFFTSLSYGQSVILQGLRMIPAMAKAGLAGNVVSTAISILFFYLFGFEGIAFAFIAGSFILYFFTHIYYRKLNLPKVAISHNEAFSKGMTNLRLGLFIVTAGIVNYLSMLVIRSFLTNEIDLAAVGVFQAVWVITNNYLMLILKSMGTDYFPRLCSVAENDIHMRKLVNEQIYIVLVVSIPVVVVMMLFSKLILSLLYTADFQSGEVLLQWQLAASFMKVISWPLAFIMLARGKGAYYLFSEFLFFATYLGCSFLLFRSHGLEAVGIAYFVAYVVYLLTVYVFSVKICHFRWTGENLRMCAVCTLFIVLSVLILLYLPGYRIVAGTVLSFAVGVYATFMLNKVFDIKGVIAGIKSRIFGSK